jgi:hypothetical protein
VTKKRSPTALSKDWLAARGFITDDGERWIPKTNIRKDLFGFADIVATDGKEFWLVQVTSASNGASRLRKILGKPSALLCLKAGVRVFVHGWKHGDMTYCVEVTSEMFTEGIA